MDFNQLIAKLGEKMEEVEFERCAEENQPIAQVSEQRMMLEDQLHQTQETVYILRKHLSFVLNQLFELHAESVEDRAGKQSEDILLMDEVEQAQTSLLSLEREVQANEEGGHMRHSCDSLDAEELPNFETTQESSLKLKAFLDEKEVEIEELKKELRARPTEKLVEDLRNQIKILQVM